MSQAVNVGRGLARSSTFDSLAGIPTQMEGEEQVRLLWEKAMERFNSKLTTDEDKKFDLTTQQQASFKELSDSAEQARKLAEGKRYKYTGKILNIIGLINQYATAGDVIVSFNPNPTALAWGAFRFLLLFAVQEKRMSEGLTGALERIARIVFRADEYAKLFSRSSADKIFERLKEDLILLYAETLNFLIRARDFFDKGSIRRFFSSGFHPFDTKLQGILDQIILYEGNVEKDVGLLRTELEVLEEEYKNGVWLCAVDFTIELQKLEEQHVDKTGEWFLGNPEVKSWIGLSSSSFLWVQGKPGSGKSTLAALLIRRLALLSNTPVLNVFCKTGQENKNNLLSVLRNIIFQLLHRNQSSQKALHEIIRAARLNSKTENAQSMSQLWSILRRLFNIIPGCFCIIDALDECSEPSNEISTFIDNLTKVSEAAPAVKLLVISRLERPKTVTSWQLIQIGNHDVKGDIELLISHKLEGSPTLSPHTPELKDRLRSALIKGSQGMILWTSLMISELEARHMNVDAVFEKAPIGLSELYSRILHRFRERPGFSVAPTARILQLVLTAARPLRLEEFVFGVAMLDTPADSDFDIHEYYRKRTPQNAASDLLDQVSPLVTLMPDGTVQLVHASLKDFLLGREIHLEPTLSHFYFDSAKLHELVATALVLYLSLKRFHEDIVGEDWLVVQEQFPLVEYASTHFIWHITKAQDISEKTTQVFGAFFTSTKGWIWLQNLEKKYGGSSAIGHIQVLQSKLNEWMSLLHLETRAIWEDNGSKNFVLNLNRKRFQDTSVLGAEDVLRIKAMINLAMTYSKQGHSKEAEDLYLQVLASRKKVLGDEHPDILQAMGDLAATYSNQGRSKEAEDLKLQVLASRKKVLGDEHPDTLQAMGGLAATYSKQGRSKEAEDLKLQVLASRKKVLGDEHPDTLQTMGSLAITYSNQGRSKEAEDLYLQVLASRKKVLGDEHPDTLQTVGNLAITYSNQGRSKEAEDLYLQVLASRKKVLGDEHPDTLQTVGNLAITYSKQGRSKEAEDLELQVLASRKKVLGDEHPDTFRAMGSLAATYSKQGHSKEAEDLYLQVLASRKKVLGDEHPDTLQTMGNLAITYSNQGHSKGAEDLYLQVLASRKKVLGDEHPDTLRAMGNLAIMYSNQGRSKEAEDLKLQVLASRKKVLGGEHPDTLQTMGGLAIMYSNQGRSKEAEDLYLQVLVSRKKVLGDEHPDTLEAKENLALMYEKQGRWGEARSLRESENT